MDVQVSRELSVGGRNVSVSWEEHQTYGRIRVRFELRNALQSRNLTYKEAYWMVRLSQGMTIYQREDVIKSLNLSSEDGNLLEQLAEVYQTAHAQANYRCNFYIGREHGQYEIPFGEEVCAVRVWNAMKYYEHIRLYYGSHGGPLPLKDTYVMVGVGNSTNRQRVAMVVKLVERQGSTTVEPISGHNRENYGYGPATGAGHWFLRHPSTLRFLKEHSPNLNESELLTIKYAFE